MQEIWKDIVGYEGKYQVSNMGNVKSLSYGPSNAGNRFAKVLKLSKNSSGYYKVQLYKNKKYKILYVHRLVADAFIPNPENKPEVNHIDGNKTNNLVTNLEWSTSSENQLHAIKTGLRVPSPMTGKTGSLNPKSKPILQYDKNGNFMRKWDSSVDAATYYNTSAKHIRNCVEGYSHSSAGFIWKPYQPNYPLKIESLKTIYNKNLPVRKGVHKRKIKVNQYTKDGILIKQWKSLEEISQYSSFSTNTILRNINGKRKSAYGFVWKIAND